MSAPPVHKPADLYPLGGHGDSDTMDEKGLLRAAGVGVAHWTDEEAKTGCTVFVLPAGSIASGEIRGSAPATREFGLLAPLASVQTVDAIVLSGGSAFGLAAGDGVADVLEAAGRGFVTRFGNVPIVVGLSLYDLGVGRADVRPGAAEGRAAASLALEGRIQALRGPVGAGAGATTGKWGGPATTASGGLGLGVVVLGSAWVMAIAAVNAFGYVGRSALAEIGEPVMPPIGENTTIGVVLTNVAVDKAMCHRVAQGAHDGYARSIFPAHTAVDGDAVVAAGVGLREAVEANPMWLRAAAEQAAAQAVLDASEASADPVSTT